MRTTTLILCLCLAYISTVSYADWFGNNVIESSMKNLGFKLKKKDIIDIPYSDKTFVRYIFNHPIHRLVVVDEYPNGFIEIRAHYHSSQKDSNLWHLTVSRVVTVESFGETIYKIFVKGEN